MRLLFVKLGRGDTDSLFHRIRGETRTPSGTVGEPCILVPTSLPLLYLGEARWPTRDAAKCSPVTQPLHLSPERHAEPLPPTPDAQHSEELSLGEVLLWGSLKSLSGYWASPVAQLVKNPLQCGRPGFDPQVGKIPWRREWLPTPAF